METLKVSFAIEVDEKPENSVINAIVLTLFQFKTGMTERDIELVKIRNRQIEDMKKLLDCLKADIRGDE